MKIEVTFISFLFNIFSYTMLPKDIGVIDLNRRIDSLECQFKRLNDDTNERFAVLNTKVDNFMEKFSNMAKSPTEGPHQSAFASSSAPVLEYSRNNINNLVATAMPRKWKRWNIFGHKDDDDDTDTDPDAEEVKIPLIHQQKKANINRKCHGIYLKYLFYVLILFNILYPYEISLF